MKTFLNVLYRRILYKIPFKWLLVFVVVLGLFLFSRVNAGLELLSTTELHQGNNQEFQCSVGDIMCLRVSYCLSLAYSFGLNQNANSMSNWANTPLPGEMGICTNSTNTFKYSVSNSCTIYADCYSFTNYTSLQCQTEYNLIPISSVDATYCENNFGLIDPSECTGGDTPECPTCPSNPGGSLTDLYINNILHVGAPTIIMNIDEEIDWDYAYTSGGNVMNIDVVGYNVDYEKIGAIVENQSYTPTGEDFQRIISFLAPYTKIIVFFVFLFIVWAWIKKPFKSKKL